MNTAVVTVRWTLRHLAAALTLVASANLIAQPSNQVFTCVTANGRTITSDRLIAECMDREQRVLSRDGILQRVIPPQLTAEERAAQDARERRVAAEKEARAEAARSDRNLLLRYPSEAGHANARDAALEDARTAMKLSEMRLADLARDRKPLLEEAEFYKGKTLPPMLKQKLDAVDASEAAQRQAVVNQQSELARIARLFDIELARLKKLWAGAAPGSLGTMAAVPTASVPAAHVTPASNKSAKKL